MSMTTPSVTVPVEPTEAMRLVPDRVLTETLYWMARAYERVHSMPRVSDTELANKIEAAKADLGRARDASPVLSNSAAPAPEGGAVPDDVRRLVIAARNVAFDTPTQSELRALDIASEAFASRVPWDDEPEGPDTREEAPAEAGEDDVQRTASGETVLGFKVAAWQYLGPSDEGDAKCGHRYCEHWSTVGNHPKKVVRLFTEDQLRAALRAQPPAREVDDKPLTKAQRLQLFHILRSGSVEVSGSWSVFDALATRGLIYISEYRIGFYRARATEKALAAYGSELGINALATTHPAPDALRVAVEALGPFNRAYQAYLAAYANFMPSGATEAEQRFAEGERKDTAEEAAFEVLSKITLEQLCAVNEALAALQAEQKGGA